jgi:hypothetical protein
VVWYYLPSSSQLNALHWRYETVSKLVDSGSSDAVTAALAGEQQAMSVFAAKDAEIAALTAALEGKFGLEALMAAKKKSTSSKRSRRTGTPEVTGERYCTPL